MGRTPERRVFPREGMDPRVSLERGLASRRLMQEAWRGRLDAARQAHDSDQTAAAQAKLEECEREIARIEALLAKLR
jgi:hypothetical protein